MAETGSTKRSTSARTKAMAGLVTVLLAAAVIALVFVTNGSGDKNNNQSDAAGSPSDVGNNSSVSKAPATTVAPSASHSVDASSTAKPAPKTSTPKTSTPKSATVAPARHSSTSSSTTHSSQGRSITYTVKKGDNLTVIARWFHQHGYGDLYEKNKSVIGNDPDLIFPGEKITVSGAGMTTSG